MPPTDETTTSDVPDAVPTQTSSIPNPENTGVGQPRPPSSELPSTPDSVLSQWFPDTRFRGNLGAMSDVPNAVPTLGVLGPGVQEDLLPEEESPGDFILP